MIISMRLFSHVLHKNSRYCFLFTAIASVQIALFVLLNVFLFWFNLFEDADSCLPQICDHLLLETQVQICTSYRKGLFIGKLCPELCDKPQVLKLVSCPNLSGHNGKDCVILSQNVLSNQYFIIKSRVFTVEELLGKDLDEFRLTQSKYLQSAIPDMLSDRIELSNMSLSSLFDLISPWPYQNQNFTEHELLNLWFLLQDNEYVLSKARVNDLLYPPIVSSCGHFYSVDALEKVIDYSYFVPGLFNIHLRTNHEKFQFALDLLYFLRRFILSRPKLELCDVKYSHFGYLNNDRNDSSHNLLVLLDSDMIYSLDTVNRSIYSIRNCHSDEDCHFIDCQGECIESFCRINYSDTDLKRICRNIFFMGKLYGVIEFGLLTHLDNSFHDSIREIYELCFDQQSTLLNNNDLVHLQRIEIILRKLMHSSQV